MKFIVAVKYKFNTEIFEFDSEEARNAFVSDVRPVALDIALSQIEDDGIWTDKKVKEFVKIYTTGKYREGYEHCRTMDEKIEKFKTINKIT